MVEVDDEEEAESRSSTAHAGSYQQARHHPFKPDAILIGSQAPEYQWSQELLQEEPWKMNFLEAEPSLLSEAS